MGALQRISTGQMEKAPIMSLEIILRKSESLPKNLGLWGGGEESIVDKPHVYLPDWGSGTWIFETEIWDI